MDWWEGDMTLENREPKEILMILQPRAIPEAIKSLNTLDIEIGPHRNIALGGMVKLLDFFKQHMGGE